jgi:hypothetical protein
MQSQLRRLDLGWPENGLFGPIRAPASTEIAKAAATIINSIIIETSIGLSLTGALA